MNTNVKRPIAGIAVVIISVRLIFGKVVVTNIQVTTEAICIAIVTEVTAPHRRDAVVIGTGIDTNIAIISEVSVPHHRDFLQLVCYFLSSFLPL